MTLDDLHTFFPFIVMGVCYLIGKAIDNTSKIPNWLIPPVLTLTGLLSGVAMAVTKGGTWKDALLTSLMGLLSGAGTVGIHQTYHQPAGAMKAKKAEQDAKAAAPATPVADTPVAPVAPLEPPKPS